MFRRLAYYLAFGYVRLRWFILGDYYNRLIVQARHLYKSSELFRARWQEVDIDYAYESFDRDEDLQLLFFHKAQKEPFVIRWEIFKDSAMRRPFCRYVLKDSRPV